VIWIVLAGLAAAGEQDCTTAQWRHATAMAAAVEAPAELRETLSSSAWHARNTGPCTSPTPPSPECLDVGSEHALAAATAFARRVEASERASEIDDLSTLAARSRAHGKRVPEDTGKFVLRVEREAGILTTEQAWLDASAAWNAARCDASCGNDDCDRHGGSAKMIDRMRSLYADLSAAQGAFPETFSIDALKARLTAADAGGKDEDVLLARALTLRSVLADSHVRPVLARGRLAGTLAHLDGTARLSTDTRRTLQAWIVYEASWRRGMDKVDDDLERIMATWRTMDAQRERGSPPSSGAMVVQRLTDAIATLQDRVTGVPGAL